MRLNYRKHFGAKVFYLFGVFIVLMSSAFSAVFVLSQTSASKAELRRKGETLAELLAHSSRAGVFAENRKLLEDAVRGVIAQEDVLEVSVYNSDGKPLLVEKKTGRGNQPFATPSPADRDIPAALRGRDALLVIEEGRGLAFLKPVLVEIHASAEALYFETDQSAKNELIVGHVKVVLDRGVLKREVFSILRRSALIAALFLVFGAAAVFMAVRKVTRPLVALTEKVRSLGLGETVEKVPVESEDEIGKLAEAFNTMAGNLRKREEEKRQIEEKLCLSEKMEAVGRLARGLAHDFNNILTTVQGSVYILRKRLEGNAQLTHYTEQIQTSLAKSKNLIQGLLSFSKTQSVRLVPMDVNKVIARLRPVMENLVGEKVEIELALSPESLVIPADQLQIEQVLMNLCTNARDAMPTGGLFAIKTEPLCIGQDNSHDHALAKPGDYVLLSARDTGIGMDQATRERIFEPFFSTKAGKGTGLGLSIVFGIIEQHGGRIEVRSEAGKGTEFRIYLPRLEKDRGNV